MRESLETLITKSDEIAQAQRANFHRLETHLKSQQQNADEVVAIRIAFRDGDPRLCITSQLEGSDDYRGMLEDVGPVICQEVKSDEVRGEWGSRHTEIYQCISNGTFVQAFYGVAEHRGKRFAVMQDLTGNKTLAAAIQSQTTSYQRLASLRFAYELAHAVAYLHSVGIVIKNLSDTNVVVIELEGGRLQPCLTNLEQARRVRRAWLALTEFDSPITTRCRSSTRLPSKPMMPGSRLQNIRRRVHTQHPQISGGRELLILCCS